MGATPSNQRTATNFLLATVIICFFRGLPTIFGKRLYALKFLSFLGYVSHQVTIQGHLIIFLFSNIPHEKSRLFPWKTAQNGTGYLAYFCCAFDALLALLSIFFPLLDHYAAHVGRQRALLHENPSSRLQPIESLVSRNRHPRGMSISNCLRKRWAGAEGKGGPPRNIARGMRTKLF